MFITLVVIIISYSLTCCSVLLFVAFNENKLLLLVVKFIILSFMVSGFQCPYIFFLPQDHENLLNDLLKSLTFIYTSRCRIPHNLKCVYCNKGWNNFFFHVNIPAPLGKIVLFSTNLQDHLYNILCPDRVIFPLGSLLIVLNYDERSTKSDKTTEVIKPVGKFYMIKIDVSKVLAWYKYQKKSTTDKTQTEENMLVVYKM